MSRKSIASTPDEAFEFAFRPSESLLHGFALIETHAHLRQGRLRINLLAIFGGAGDAEIDSVW